MPIRISFYSDLFSFLLCLQVYDAAVRWLKYDEPNRQPYMVDILAKVRFPLISKNFLSKTVQAEPLIQDNPECLKMVISKFFLGILSIFFLWKLLIPLQII